MKKLLTMLVALTCVTAVGLSACKNEKTGTAASGTTATSTTATSTTATKAN